MVAKTDFCRAVELISDSSDILLTCHARPDGDSCGCMRAMSEILVGLGKKVRMLLLSPLPDWYGFLFDSVVPVLGNDISVEQLHAGHFDSCDLVIIVDTNSYVQLPQFDRWLKATSPTVLVLDHHVTSDGLGDVELVDSTAAATGEIVLDLIRHANWPMTVNIAEAIFVALSTDSGWFKFRNVSSRLFRDAADLIDAGANPAEIFGKLYQNFSPQRMQLMIRMLGGMELHFANRLATQCITRSDFDQTGSTGKDTENFVNECQRIASVEVAALFVELADGGFRCSLRSKGDVDVRVIAQRHGGGGHTAAAAVNLPGPFENAKNIILQEVKARLD